MHFEIPFPMFLFLSSILGLMLGSFLNVVIYRLPKMIDQSCKAECRAILELPELPHPEKQEKEPLGLLFPRSHCPHCQHLITWKDNIPVLSYVLLRGRCRYCQTSISLRYPFIEILTSILTLVVAAHLGLTLQSLAAWFLLWALIALTFIDFEHSILPDNITLPFLWLGLLLNLFGLFQPIDTAVIGSMAGYLSLFSIFWLFKWTTGKEGMGYGDFKLLGMLGAWLGWKALPFIILISSCLGAMVGITLILFYKKNTNTAIPFGPYLAFGGFLTLLWETNFLDFYFDWIFK